MTEEIPQPKGMSQPEGMPQLSLEECIGLFPFFHKPGWVRLPQDQGFQSSGLNDTGLSCQITPKQLVIIYGSERSSKPVTLADYADDKRVAILYGRVDFWYSTESPQAREVQKGLDIARRLISPSGNP